MDKNVRGVRGLVFLLILVGGASHALGEDEAVVIPWEEKSPVCVAWEADKLFMLVSDERPVGVNCSGVFLMEQTTAGVVGVVDVPVQGFESGEETRDEEVVELLSGNNSRSLTFKTKPYSRSEWRTNVMTSKGAVEGVLTIAGQETPVTLSFTEEGQYLVGKLRTSFSALKLEPPSVGWGSIALVRDPLVLHFRVQKALTRLL